MYQYISSYHLCHGLTAMAIEKAMSISSDDRFNSVEDFWRELNSHTPKQQVDTPLLKSQVPAKLQAVPEQQLKPLKTPPPALHHQAQPPKSRKKSILLYRSCCHSYASYWNGSCGVRLAT